MKLTVSQLLKFLLKAQKLGIEPEINEFDGDFIIYFNDIYGRDMTESILITKDDEWKGYGWTYESIMNVLDKKINELNKGK